MKPDLYLLIEQIKYCWNILIFEASVKFKQKSKWFCFFEEPCYHFLYFLLILQTGNKYFALSFLNQIYVFPSNRPLIFPCKVFKFDYTAKSDLCKQTAKGIPFIVWFWASLSNYSSEICILSEDAFESIRKIIPWVPSKCCFQNMRCLSPPAISCLKSEVQKK